MVSETTKQKVDRLECKVDKLADSIENLRDNHIYHLSIDISNIKGQLIYIKWFILAVLGLVIASGVKVWLI
jgi:hypothetical protein